jgi:hypothetical protein
MQYLSSWSLELGLCLVEKRTRRIFQLFFDVTAKNAAAS